MKKQILILINAVLLSISAHAAEENTASPGIAVDPQSTERNPGPPALTPAETRAKQEQERMLNRTNSNNTQVVPIGSDNAAGKNFPGTLPGTNQGLNNGGNGNQPPSDGGNNGTGTNGTNGTSTAPSTPVAPPTGNPGVQ